MTHLRRIGFPSVIGELDQSVASCRKRARPLSVMLDLASRINGRVQFTTDVHRPYGWATALAFEDGEVDYDQLIKRYAGVDTGRADLQVQPARVLWGVNVHVRSGARASDPDHVQPWQRA